MNNEMQEHKCVRGMQTPRVTAAGLIGGFRGGRVSYVFAGDNTTFFAADSNYICAMRA